ncbi:PilZ domain-containing protein [Sphingomonas sp. LHG3406-1]|uniref:PilZ domain-containing protein n=1 Tax=Sphingomonas sp. LHG3406-1 TaxID=2804617 RepID=UPI0026126D00|nr:PilZ domain-containing protein [Sphingomonas sp. LHG3406-1]
MNEFRDRLFGGKSSEAPLLRAKKGREAPSRAAEDESFAELAIPRDAPRRANHRDGDRHRLDSEQVEIVHEGESYRVNLINLSGGGAMIEGPVTLKLWDRVELRFGEWSRVEAAVRWVRGDRFGLEFAHETRIETGSEELNETLRAVIMRSFPDLALAADAGPAPEPEQATEADFPTSHAEREIRHPLIWSGAVHHCHDTTPVRIRNISSNGALIEGGDSLPVGAELLLDLGEAGAIFASVHWSRGDSAGLRFHVPYDLRQLAEARPEVAGPRWIAPDYLRDDRSSNSPWASQWNRGDVTALHRALQRRRGIRKS